MSFPRASKFAVIFALALLMVQAGCLRTRAQMKGGDDEVVEEGSGGGAGKPPAKGMRYEMEELKNEMTRLSGKVDQVEYQQRAQGGSEIKETVSKLENRINDLEKNQMLIMSELQGLKEKQEVTAKAASTSTKTLLSEGNKLLKAKKYEEAAEKFKLVLTKNPKGKEAAEAHFGVGEAEYGAKNFKKAIVEYSKVQDAFAKSDLVPTSLYKIGQSFTKINMGKEAKGFYAELVEKYPKSPEAKKVKNKSQD